ncbi:MAG: discoidin domain-containing protein, partial [Gammaproteobacteria bacterium]|nr:discoidin domain-containing protein [Gammaproteobacteria bacterium]
NNFDPITIETLSFIEQVSDFNGYLDDPSNLLDFGDIIASSAAMTAIAESSTAMSAVAASSTAMTAIAASSTAMSAIAASSTAMSAVAASSTAMSAIAESSTAMTAILANSTARALFIASTAIPISNTAKMTSDSTPAPFVSRASSQLNTDYAAWKAFNQGTLSDGFWSPASNSSGNYIAYDFNVPVLVHTFEIYQSSSTYFAKSYVIEFSDDDINWSIAATVVNSTYDTGSVIRTIPVNEAARHRYWRMRITSANNSTYETFLYLANFKGFK